MNIPANLLNDDEKLNYFFEKEIIKHNKKHKNMIFSDDIVLSHHIYNQYILSVASLLLPDFYEKTWFTRNYSLSGDRYSTRIIGELQEIVVNQISNTHIKETTYTLQLVTLCKLILNTTFNTEKYNG